jgi:hypothetical protein
MMTDPNLWLPAIVLFAATSLWLLCVLTFLPKPDENLSEREKELLRSIADRMPGDTFVHECVHCGSHIQRRLGPHRIVCGHCHRDWITKPHRFDNG